MEIHVKILVLMFHFSSKMLVILLLYDNSFCVSNLPSLSQLVYICVWDHQILCVSLTAIIIIINDDICPGLEKIAQNQSPKMQILRTFWNSPVGPKTTHFWGPVFNWGIPIAVCDT